MRLFLREHLGIIALFALLVCGLLPLYQRVGGFNTTGGMAYFLGLSDFLLATTLVVRYFRRRRLYRWLDSPGRVLEELLGQESTDPLVNAFIRHGNASYQRYLGLLTEQQAATEQWRTHIVQWVHQMKTPLSVIRLLAQDDEGSRDPFPILCELDRLQRQLDLVLSLARIDRFENDLVTEQVHLDDLAVTVMQQNQRLFRQSEVSVTCTGEDVVVTTDRKWIGFVADQLIHNAVKFSEPGSSVEVRIGARPEGAQLSVIDTGCGIRPRDLPRVCDLYYTGSNGRAGSQSSGVGLYLVKQVLERLGHSLRITSAVDEGTTVTVRFGASAGAAA
ncbi:sensor histidine kinase [Actinomyces qiguomingii]|uniref:sensor histidine kinase n=1 Tax=Actinomyces qiguomingii TaxID=2057800 RepID=UPI000CA05C3C|nr:ATP-binding protein [Actinomyces qiguomingii]